VALILCIDDDGFYRGVLRRMLQDDGHQVVEAADGHEGLECFRKRQPDLVITDMRMPGFDGGQVICKLREMSKTIPILAVSGAATSDSTAGLQRARQVGVNAIVSKLGPLDQILETIDRIFASPAK
jgi:two-component system chemotaxis sensor kinase CheA